MSIHEYSQHPLKLFVSSEYRLMSRMAREYPRVGFLRSGEASLQGVMEGFSRSFIQETEEIHLGVREKKDMRAYLLSIEGTPGSGKTFLNQQLIQPYLHTFQQLMKMQNGINVTIQTLHWDSVEAMLEREGKIRQNRTNADGAFLESDTDQDLEIIAKTYKVELAKLLEKKDPYTIIVADRLNGTGLKRGGVTFATRPYGSETMSEILQSEGAFSRLRREDMWVGAVGCVGSPATEVYTQYRQEVMEAYPSLEKVNAINRRYRKPRMTQEQLDLATLSGSMSVVKIARARSWAMGRFALRDEEAASKLPAYIQAILTSSRISEADESIVEMQKTPEGNALYEKAKATSEKLHTPWQSVLWRACYRLAEAILLEKSFLLDMPIGPHPDAASVVYNDPPF